MAKLIDQIDSSGLFAQSAYSAAIATNDDLGRKISETYLTAHQDLSDYATTAQVNTVSSLLSAGLDYVSANAGKTYTGVAPIIVDNELNEISITGEGLSAGPNIDIFSSGGYVIISGSSGRDFTNEITAASSYAYNSATAQINSTSSYLNSAITSTSSYLNGAITSTSSYLSAAINYVSGNAGSNYTGVSPIYVNNTTKQISADTWSLSAGAGVTFTDDYVNKVTVLDVTGVNTYCFNFPNGVTSVDLANFNNYNKVTIVHNNDNMPDYHLYWDGKTKVIPSGLYCEMVKGKDIQNNIKWSFAQSAWINDNWWDWD